MQLQIAQLQLHIERYKGLQQQQQQQQQQHHQLTLGLAKTTTATKAATPVSQTTPLSTAPTSSPLSSPKMGEVGNDSSEKEYSDSEKEGEGEGQGKGDSTKGSSKRARRLNVPTAIKKISPKKHKGKSES